MKGKQKGRVNAFSSDVSSTAITFPETNSEIQVTGIIPIYSWPDHAPLHSKTKQVTEITPVLIPKLPLSTTANQFIDSLSGYMTNSAWQSTMGESLLVNQLWQQDGSLVAVLANHWVVATLKHSLWEISITPFLNDFLFRVVFKTLEIVINRGKCKWQSSGKYRTGAKSCPKSFLESCFWELLHDITMSGLKGAQEQPHLTRKPNFLYQKRFDCSGWGRHQHEGQSRKVCWRFQIHGKFSSCAVHM